MFQLAEGMEGFEWPLHTSTKVCNGHSGLVWDG